MMALILAVAALMVGTAAAQPRAGSCVAAGFSNCCIDDGICQVNLGCYCDRICYSAGDCCYDIAQTCDRGISITTNGTARSGEDFILTCSITSQLQGSWQYIALSLYDDHTGTAVVLRNDSTNSTQTLTLELFPLQTSHGGRYTCEVSSEFPALRLTKAVNVEINSPSVSISQSPSNNPLTVGDSTNLTCIIVFSESVDTPEIEVNVTWIGPQNTTILDTSNISDLTLVQGTAVLTFESTLSLSSLELSDFGAYTCIALGDGSDLLPFVNASEESSATFTLMERQPDSSSHITAIAAGVAAGVVALIVAAVLIGVGCILLRKHSWLVAERDPAGNQNSGAKEARVQAVSFPNPVPKQSEEKDKGDMDFETVECVAYGVHVAPRTRDNPYSVPRQQNHYPVPKQQENGYSVPRRQQETDPTRHYSVPSRVPSLVPRPAPKPAPRPVQITPAVQHIQLQTTDNIYDDDLSERHIYEPLTL